MMRLAKYLRFCAEKGNGEIPRQVRWEHFPVHNAFLQAVKNCREAVKFSYQKTNHYGSHMP